MRRVHVYPIFDSRNLGEFLFPYARALVLAGRNGWGLIDPDWPGGRMFRQAGAAGLRKILFLLMRPKISEKEVMEGKATPGSVVTVYGPGNHFRDVSRERDYIAQAMGRIFRRRDAAKVQAHGPYDIGVHLRPGVPEEWYIRTLEKVRAIAGREVPVAVFGDCPEGELSELPEMPGVKRLSLGPAADLFALSSCKVVLSADSAFAAWAAFLGHIPIIWERRGPELEDVFADETFNGVLGLDAELPEQFRGYLRRRLGQVKNRKQ